MLSTNYMPTASEEEARFKELIRKDGRFINNLVNDLIRYLREIPTSQLSSDIKEPLARFSEAYEREGLGGALPHAELLISKLRKLNKGSENWNALTASEVLATALDYGC
jgi:hypothetical protein